LGKSRIGREQMCDGQDLVKMGLSDVESRRLSVFLLGALWGPDSSESSDLSEMFGGHKTRITHKKRR